MKKTIKLRDMTEEQFKKWLMNNCNAFAGNKDKVQCEDCLFRYIACEGFNDLWTEHKDFYSDKFLDQTIEIEVPDLLTEEEKSLLKQLVKLSARRITGIEFGEEENDIYVGFMVAELLEDNERFDFKKGLFKGVEMGKLYSLSDLGLEDK